jgi:hypothetical protein
VEYRVCFKSGPYGFHHPSAMTLPCLRNIKLWNSVLLVAVESRKVIIARDDTPSASGTLLGSDLFTCLLVHEMMVKQRIITTKDDFFKVLFIGQGLMNYPKLK